jgi:hypothetical protein
LGEILGDVLAETSAPLELLVRIEHTIPNPTLILAVADLAVQSVAVR